MKPWEKPVYACDGDYRKEVFLEAHVGGPLYKEQKNMPRLPIPTLEDTIERFLPTALPLARTKEEEFALKEACKSFPEQAKALHERLNEKRENEMKDSSWLQVWWNQLGYLQVRDSVVHNVSYFFHFREDPTINASSQSMNIQRAAAALFATAEFREKVCTGQLPAEKVGRKETRLCSTAYKYMFNACRIPYKEQDSYHIYDPSCCSHAIVARKGHFFSIDIVDKSGDPLPVSVIEGQLQKCVDIANSLPISRPKLGVLTSINRDSWAKMRERLIESGGKKMEKALEKLQSGAIVLNLDNEEPVSRKDCAVLFLSGGLNSGHNRWFDKSINLMVANNGRAALIGEHSMMDGMPLVRYADYVTNVTYEDAIERSAQLSCESSPQVHDIFADIFEEMDSSILEKAEVEAWSEFEGCIRRQSTSTQSFQAYGSNFIKNSGHSPDAFVQLAMQLATYRLFGEQVGTYEATQVRPFLHGRTETTRAVSLESMAFVKHMGLRPSWDETDPDIITEKLDLLQKATNAHSHYTRNAAQAQGVDRHFFGLSMFVEEDELSPELFSDPVFIRSKRWRVSTSHLTHPNFLNWGFGQVVPDGVGIGYSIHPRSCIFNITALEETGWTESLSELIEEALLEMQRLIETDGVG